ncbi:MAG: diacylglycerol kinase family protein [Clostridia bacterium]|nr:diacylglycerol kinase family protein [Clostridia bacterium]
MKNKKKSPLRRQLASFAAAGRGLWVALREESHLRFHLVAAVYVLYFSRWYGFARGEYALLFVLFGLVCGLEMANSALERLCDRVCGEYDPAIGRVKDMAAGAVLAAAVCAVGVALVLFWQPAVLAAIAREFWGQPWRLALLLLSAVFSVWFICGFSAKNKNNKKTD